MVLKICREKINRVINECSFNIVIYLQTSTDRDILDAYLHEDMT